MTTPKWRDAWKVDDPEWIKERKREWKRVLKSPGFLQSGATKNERGYIKNYFFTGSAFAPELPEEEWRFMRYDPDNSPLPVANSTLFEVWLSANQSEAHLDFIRARAHELTYVYSRELLCTLYATHMPEEGGIFLEADERIYRFFTPTRFRKKDYEGVKDDEFNRLARNRFVRFGNAIQMYMVDTFNQNNIAPVFLIEWMDCVVPAFLHFVAQGADEKSYMHNYTARIDRAVGVLRNPGEFECQQVDFARNLVTGFQKLDMPMKLSQLLDPHMAH